MDLQTPTAKMSKSTDSPQGTVNLLDSPDVIAKKIKSAVTDSDTEIRYDPEAKPGVTNLLDVYAAVTATPVATVADGFGGQGYGALKTAVADAVVEFLAPLQTRFAELAEDTDSVDEALATGAGKAGVLSAPVLERVRTAVGLLPRAD